jgi:hypothetical protein
MEKPKETTPVKPKEKTQEDLLLEEKVIDEISLADTKAIVVGEKNWSPVTLELMLTVQTGICSLKTPPKEEIDTGVIDVKLDDDEDVNDERTKRRLDKIKEEILQKKENERRIKYDAYLLECVTDLVKRQGGKLDQADFQSMTPLHFLAMRGAADTLKWCIEQGAKKNV